MSKKVLIVEDDPILGDEIDAIISDAGYETVGVARSAHEALEILGRTEPDLILLDIELEGDVDGVMLAEKVNESYGIPFVYLTSYTDKVTIDRVKRTHPAGFIEKPFTKRSIISNIEIAMYKDTPTKLTYDELFVRDGNALVKVKFDDILYLQAYDNYTLVFTSAKKYTITQTLKTVESKVPSTKFVRIHRSYVINLDVIEKITDGHVELQGKSIPIGRTYQHFLLSKLNRI
jgi:DNA-binding LytR/AlgR family response regulator